MMEEISITLINSLVFSSIVFFPLKLTGDFILFWLINLTTTSIGIGNLLTFAHLQATVVRHLQSIGNGFWLPQCGLSALCTHQTGSPALDTI